VPTPGHPLALALFCASLCAGGAVAQSPSATPAAPPTATPSPASSARPSVPPPASELTPEQLQAIVREVSAAVEKIRRLKFKTPVSMEIIDGAAARESFGSKIEAGTIEQARHAQRAYIQLGLVPAGTDLLRNYLDQAETDVLGYYDSRSKKLFLLSHVPAAQVREVVAHELTHALEDQHYDFLEIGKRANGDDDHATAISSVIEGSAMVVMATFARGEPRPARGATETAEKKRTARLRGAPSFVQQSVMMPYLLGFSFLLRGKPWNFAEGVPVADLTEVYANPPRSTTQILHPEQYWWGKWRKPQPPPGLPDLSKELGPGWSKTLEGSIGELGLAVLTGSRLDVGSPFALLPSRWTQEAASGTAGDVFHHYVNGEQGATALLTRWETLRDAEQFDRALLSRGRHFLRFGANVLVLSGDYEQERAVGMAKAAMQSLSYWPEG